MAIRVVVWGENIHDRENAVVRDLYPNGMHGTIAEALNQDAGIEATTATMEQPEHGLTEERLAAPTSSPGGVTGTTAASTTGSSSASPSGCGKAWGSSSSIPGISRRSSRS